MRGMQKFEGVIVGYMLNMAGMPFFRVGCYPAFDFQDGKLVVAKDEATQKLQADCRAFKALIEKIQDRVKRDMRVPKTWQVELAKAETLVMAMEECKVVGQEWAQEFHRTLRWLPTYQPEVAA